MAVICEEWRKNWKTDLPYTSSISAMGNLSGRIKRIEGKFYFFLNLRNDIFLNTDSGMLLIFWQGGK